MYLKRIELSGFKSFAKKSEFEFISSIVAIVGPNGSGKSNVTEAFRFVLGEQSLKSMRTKRGEDLIWGGSSSVSRANRAYVKAVFDNTTRLFDIDFDEVSIERTVHRDGVNQYSINGSTVRLKDVVELLSGAHIGLSGHHIISQGESDRLLSASIKERREMIEDALGLKIFQYKKKESERKLAQTQENIKHVISLRKEIAPHIKFLKRQVDKIEKSRHIREEFKGLLKGYLKHEELYITHKKEEIKSKKKDPQKQLKVLEENLLKARFILEKTSGESDRSNEIIETERSLSETRRKRDNLSREIGRLEGQISFAQKHTKVISGGSVSVSEVRSLTSDIEETLSAIELSDSSSPNLGETLKGVIRKIRTLLHSFFEKYEDTKEDETDLVGLSVEKERLDVLCQEIESKEKQYAQTYKKLQEEIEATKDESRDAERDVFKIVASKNNIEGILRDLMRDGEVLTHLAEEFKRDIGEGVALVGRDILQYSSVELSLQDVLAEERPVQEKKKREIEKIKIRLEEFGGGSNEEVLKEYNEVHERDMFLEREITDLETSSQTLNNLIADLDEKLSLKFKEGVAKINKEFQHFFAVLFDGGSASLSVIEHKKKKKKSVLDMEAEELGGEVSLEDEEEEVEAGIDITVSLPRKKIKGLQMLSGGERALTSIALLFAMTQVNPPPFLVLDETEAALDEANSRKYSAMIKDLSQKTQLILITHNRETMSVAGVLYGITMGRDGTSKLLSVKLEQAVTVTK